MKTNEKNKSISRITGRGFVLVSLLAVALAASCFAQSNAAAVAKTADAKTPQPSGNSLTARAAKAPRGMGEGIQIHGWWTIEVRNRDGSAAKHVEFENSLVTDGPGTLAGLLSGNLAPGPWAVVLAGIQGGTGSPSPCSTGNVCLITEAGSAIQADFAPCPTGTVGPVTSGTQPFCYATLVPSLAGSPGRYIHYSSFTLSGQAYVDTTTTVGLVATESMPCGSTSPEETPNLPPPNVPTPSACFSSSPDLVTVGFTEYDFGAAGSCGGTGQLLCPIPVQAGQTISATVQFIFSSPSSSQSAAPALAHPHPLLRAPSPAKPPASTPVTQ